MTFFQKSAFSLGPEAVSEMPSSRSTTGSWENDGSIWIQYGLPSGYVKIAIENGPFEIVDFPIKKDDVP